MRNSVFLLMVFCTMTITVFGQNADVPVNVNKAFQQKISNAKDVEWKYDSEDVLWEAEYSIGRDEFTSSFDENGKWVETEKEMKFSKLPGAIKATLKAEYSDYEVEEVEFVESPDGKFYEVEIKLEKDKKESEFELLFSTDGIVIKKEEEKDEKE